MRNALTLPRWPDPVKGPRVVPARTMSPCGRTATRARSIHRADCSSHRQCFRLAALSTRGMRAMRIRTFLGALSFGALFLGAIGLALLLPQTSVQAQVLFWRSGPEALGWPGDDPGRVTPPPL